MWHKEPPRALYHSGYVPPSTPRVCTPPYTPSTAPSPVHAVYIPRPRLSMSLLVTPLDDSVERHVNRQRVLTDSSGQVSLLTERASQALTGPEEQTIP